MLCIAHYPHSNRIPGVNYQMFLKYHLNSFQATLCALKILVHGLDAGKEFALITQPKLPSPSLNDSDGYIPMSSHQPLQNNHQLYSILSEYIGEASMGDFLFRYGQHYPNAVSMPDIYRLASALATACSQQKGNALP